MQITSGHLARIESSMNEVHILLTRARVKLVVVGYCIFQIVGWKYMDSFLIFLFWTHIASRSHSSNPISSLLKILLSEPKKQNGCLYCIFQKRNKSPTIQDYNKSLKQSRLFDVKWHIWHKWIWYLDTQRSVRNSVITLINLIWGQNWSPIFSDNS